MSEGLRIGLDAGGTKTAVLAETGGRRWETVGPGVNLRRDGLERAAETLAGLVREVQAAFPGAPLAGLCVGVAGASGAEEALAARLRAVLALDEAVRLVVTHDAEIALKAAFQEGSGAVVIAGTGSVVYGRTRDGRLLRAGGWGHALGDAGSGTALGRAALRAVAAHLDGGPPTSLTRLLAEQHGVESIEALLDWTHAPGRALADLAPLLLAAADAGDARAADLLDQETDALARQAAWLVKRAGGGAEKRIALFGGLVDEEPYRTALLAALAHRLPGWFVSRCEHAPVEGALQLTQ